MRIPLTVPVLRSACLAILAGASCLFAGCGFERLDAPLPDAPADFTLSDLEAIQDDGSLTDDQRREMIREAVGAPETEAGDRLVEFLLTLNIP